jgi:hypothetical protein
MIIQLAGYPIFANGQDKPAQTPEELLGAAKIIRWILLNESDWTQLPDSNMGPVLKQEWAVFRQHLRDLPPTFPAELSATLEIMDPPSNAPASWVVLQPR